MSRNRTIRPEAIEMGYATVRSTHNYTVEHNIVEIESSVDVSSYGANHFFPSL